MGQEWKKKFLARNVVDPSAFKDGFESILSNFSSLGQKNVLIVHEEFLPELVCEFYANLMKLEIDRNENQ